MPAGTTRPPALLPSQALRIRHLTDREVSSKALPRSPKYFAQRQAFRPTWSMRILISSRLSHFMQFFDCRQKTRPSTFGVAHPNIDVESTIMFDSVRKELTKGARMHGSVSQLFWLQVEADFILKLRWVSSKDNIATDTLTRPESTEHVQLYHVVIDRFRLEWHGFDMDPLCRGRSGRALHIFIRDITLPEAPEYMCLHRMLSVLPSPRSLV